MKDTPKPFDRRPRISSNPVRTTLVGIGVLLTLISSLLLAACGDSTPTADHNPKPFLFQRATQLSGHAKGKCTICHKPSTSVQPLSWLFRRLVRK